jgi:hypothetical protein
LLQAQHFESVRLAVGTALSRCLRKDVHGEWQPRVVVHSAGSGVVWKTSSGNDLTGEIRIGYQKVLESTSTAEPNNILGDFMELTVIVCESASTYRYDVFLGLALLFGLVLVVIICVDVSPKLFSTQSRSCPINPFCFFFVILHKKCSTVLTLPNTQVDRLQAGSHQSPFTMPWRPLAHAHLATLSNVLGLSTP